MDAPRQKVEQYADVAFAVYGDGSMSPKDAERSRKKKDKKYDDTLWSKYWDYYD